MTTYFPTVGKRFFPLAALFLFAATFHLQAGNFIWSTTPISADWYTAANWVENTIPNGPDDTAIIDTSSIEEITIPDSSVTVLYSLVFSQNTNVYRVTLGTGASLTFVGKGAINGTFSIFFVPLYAYDGSSITFQGHARASAGVLDGGNVLFQDDSTETGCVEVYGTNPGLPAGILTFADRSRAESIINVNESADGVQGGTLYLNDDSTATGLYLSVSGDGVVDISGHHAPGVAIKRLEGDGTIFLGANNLSVMKHFPEHHFSFDGILSDGGASGGVGGSFTKAGYADTSFALTGSSTYTGGTTVTGGTLYIEADHNHSPVGTGDVEVNGGNFGGEGTVIGTVFVGNSIGTPGTLTPGENGIKSGTLTIRGALSFFAYGTLQAHLNSNGVRNGEVSANGVTIATMSLISVTDQGTTQLPPGTTFTVIDNTSSTPIAGTFANLLDGGTIVVGLNTYQANYEGGDGNDLTLTVVD